VKAIHGAMHNLRNVEYQIFVNEPTKLKGYPGIAEATNMGVDKCLGEGWDYLWIVEGDIEVPKGAFRRLFCLGADINLGIYPCHRQDELKMIAGFFYRRESGVAGVRSRFIYPLEELQGKVFTNMVLSGVGCALIHRRVFEKIVFKHDQHEFNLKVGIHDQLFLYDAQAEYGFKVFLHGDVICGHLPEWSLKRLAQGS
jgi:hypothetical protein